MFTSVSNAKILPHHLLKKTLSEDQISALGTYLARIVIVDGELIARHMVLAFNVGVDVKKMTYKQLEEEKDRLTILLYNNAKETRFRKTIEEIAQHITCRSAIFEKAKSLAGHEKFERAMDGAFSVERILTSLVVRTKQKQFH